MLFIYNVKGFGLTSRLYVHNVAHETCQGLSAGLP